MSNEVKNITERNRQVDEFEALLLDNYEPADAPIRNFFTEDLYVREMSIKANHWITSKIHKTEFVFIVSKGKLLVSMDDGEEVEIQAPYTGISKPYSRRVAFVVEDAIWTTIHRRLPNETEEEIEARIIEPHQNELITDEMKDRMSKVIKQKETILLTQLTD